MGVLHDGHFKFCAPNRSLVFHRHNPSLWLIFFYNMKTGTLPISIYLPRHCPTFLSHLAFILTTIIFSSGSAFLPKTILNYEKLVKNKYTHKCRNSCQLYIPTKAIHTEKTFLSFGRTSDGNGLSICMTLE